ncbi:MAG: DUF5677 domain-containing protein, partial [Gemmatimonadota bacterium]
RRQRTAAWSMIPGRHEHTLFIADLGQYVDSFDHHAVAPMQEQAHRVAESAGNLLSIEPYSALDAEFEKLRKGNRNKEPHWYSPLGGPPSIAKLATAVDCMAEYKVFYRTLSGTTHGDALRDHIDLHEGNLIVEPLRSPEKMREMLQLVPPVVLRVFRNVTEYYRSGELDVLSKVYAEEWRARILSVPTVSVTLQHRPL